MTDGSAGDVETADYFLTTDRLGFRTWNADDIELAVALWGDPEVTRHIRSGGPPPRAEIEARLAREMASQAEHGIQYWPIFLRRDGSHVGCCGLCPHDPAAAVPELGFHLRPGYWRQGLAREAARAVIDHAFDRLGARALFAGHSPHNTASRDLLAALGFRRTHEQLYPPTGLMHPCYLLPREAWAGS
jgi:[ribosomal protein S5]-alanine N-acetyltransferase